MHECPPRTAGMQQRCKFGSQSNSTRIFNALTLCLSCCRRLRPNWRLAWEHPQQRTPVICISQNRATLDQHVQHLDHRSQICVSLWVQGHAEPDGVKAPDGFAVRAHIVSQKPVNVIERRLPLQISPRGEYGSSRKAVQATKLVHLSMLNRRICSA